MPALKDAIIKVLARLFVPEWAKEMEDEGVFRLRASMNTEVDESEYILVEDNGADVTIFVLSGLDGLFGGGRRFEFRNMLAKLGLPYNLVFVRELRGFFYHLAPNGAMNGLEFYERKLTEIKERLGATHNIAMGFSAGGGAAFYFGTRCGMQKIIGFCPSFPIAVYLSRRALLLHAFDVKKLVTDPKAYLEVSVVTIWAKIATHRFQKLMGLGKKWDIMGTYRNCPAKRPLATVLYGRHCRQDSRQAQGLADIPEVKLLPVETGFHNVPGALKQSGEFGNILINEIKDLVGENPVFLPLRDAACGS